MIKTGKPLIQKAINAQRHSHPATDEGRPAKEVGRLWAEAESLFRAVAGCQLRALSGPSGTLH